jgi:Kef-type K+ transport system membrane component KefB
MHGIFIELTTILITAGLLALVMSFFKLPSILAYLATGLLVGPLGFYHLTQQADLQSLSEIGITLLLFMIGLELDISQIKRLGKSALVAGLVQVIATLALALILATFIGIGGMAAIIVASAITFSSTIITVKILNEKREQQSLYAKLSLGILLVQDFAAVILLMLLSGSQHAASQANQITNVLFLLAKAIVLWAVIWGLSKSLFPKILRYVGKSDELLLLFSLAWALGLAMLVSQPFIGFSLEVGGFLAGLSLANSAVHYQVGARIKSLRDFFIIIFFIILGSNMTLVTSGKVLATAAIWLAFALLIKPLIVLVTLALLGYKPRTAFLASLTQTPASEFSLILVALGLQLRILNAEVAAIFTIFAIASMACASYLVSYSARIYEFLKPLVSRISFRHFNAEAGLHATTLKNHTVLIGAHRLGGNIIETLQSTGKPFVVVDFNPDVAHAYPEVHVICGDIADPHIQEIAGITRAKLIVSTVPNLHENLSLVETLRSKNGKAKIIMTAHDEGEALLLYGLKIDYVLLPHYLGGLHLAKILSEDRTADYLRNLRQRYLKILEPR